MKRALSLLAVLFFVHSDSVLANVCCSKSDSGDAVGYTCCPEGSCCSGPDSCRECVATQPLPTPAYVCPEQTPIDCGNGKCCGSNTPVCCPDTGMCATSLAACKGKVCPATSPVECGSRGCCDEAHPNCCANGCCDAAHPYCCGNGQCCDAAHPFCCPDGRCATSSAGCGNVCPAGFQLVSGVGLGATRCCPVGYDYPCGDGSCGLTPNCHGAGLFDTTPPPTSSTGGGTGSGGGGTFQCSPSNPQVTCESLSSCRTCTISSCGGPNGSGCAFYKTSDGQTFGTTCKTQSCLMDASNQALRHCGCI